MGNTQFNSTKDGGDGSGRDDGPYGTYSETRTTPGAPGPFSDAGFAPPLRGGVGRTAYAGGGGAAAIGGGAMGSGATAVGDDMDVESKTDEGEEEEVRKRSHRKNNKDFDFGSAKCCSQLRRIEEL